MATSLNPQQISILHRVGNGLGLPAYVLRPRNYAQDVEILLFFGLIASGAHGLSIEPAGSEHLAKLDATDSAEHQEGFASLRVAHGHDNSISVEPWPQEY